MAMKNAMLLTIGTQLSRAAMIANTSAVMASAENGFCCEVWAACGAPDCGGTGACGASPAGTGC